MADEPITPTEVVLADVPVTAREWLVRIFEKGNRVLSAPFATGPNWFRCQDGTCFSAIAGGGTYCSPRLFFDGVPRDFSGPYTAIEVLFDLDGEPEGWVTPERLWKHVNKHGGVVEYLPAGSNPEDAGWL